MINQPKIQFMALRSLSIFHVTYYIIVINYASTNNGLPPREIKLKTLVLKFNIKRSTPKQ